MNELAALVRFVHLTAAIVLAGGFGFELFVVRPAFARAKDSANSLEQSSSRSLARNQRYCAAILFITLLLGLWLHAASVSGSLAVTPRALLPLLTETQFGTVWLARLALLIIIAAVIAWRSSELTLGFLLSAALIAALAFAGHAAAADGIVLVMQLSADAMHLLASGVWLGGLIPLISLLRACNRKNDAEHFAVAREVTQRFSNLALASVIILIATGSYNAWNLVGGFAPLLGTAYGKLLLVKLGLLLPLLTFGAINRLRLKPTIAARLARNREVGTALRRLTRNVGIEILLGVAILLIVGHMGVTPPARHVQPEWPLSFRWDWTVLDKSPKAYVEVQRGAIWAAFGCFAFFGSLLRGRRRIMATLIGIGMLIYGTTIVHQAVMIDAYPDTYKRPAVAYQAISVTNGATLYQESGCAACHGESGHGDGPVAAELNPPPPDLTGRHANAHTAGDLFWWLSHGVKPTSAMPGFRQSLSDEERWDLINYLRALSSGQRAKNLAPVIDDQPSLVAPDFNYATVAGAAKTLKDHRGSKIVLLALLDLGRHGARLQQLTDADSSLRSAGVELIVVPHNVVALAANGRFPGFIVSEGNQEIGASYKLFAHSFSDDKSAKAELHVEYLIDKQGYIRARWLPAENDSSRNLTALKQQIDLLAKEKPRAPAPDDHVH